MFHRTSTQRDIDALKSDLKALRKDLGRLPRFVGRDGRRKLDDARERLMDAIGELEGEGEERLSNAYQAAAEYGAEAIERGRHRVEERPLTMIIGAFVVGWVLGKIVRH